MALDSRCHSPASTINEDTKTLLSSSDFPSTYLRPCLQSKCDRNRMLLGVFSGTIGLVGGIMVAYIFFLSLLTAQDSDRRLSYSKASFVDQRFSNNQLYGEPPSDASNAAWTSMIPKGRGFVRVDANTQVPYHDSPGFANSTANGSIFCLSVFHQLHCLDMLRRGYYAAEPSTHREHASHCFDYLRQAIACAADTTLEPRDAAHSGVQGWGIDHRCRNFGAVREWAERWRSNDNGGIANR